MKILHYFLGFPPYRTGGLTKYALDLMVAQVTDGNNVIALWPGKIRKRVSKPYIKKKRPNNNIENYELINPLPISLDEGIIEFEAFTKPCDINVYKLYLHEIMPDVIHIHTLMGLHREFIKAANELNIRMVYTSHDYFGLCPKVTLYRYGECCDDDFECKNCIQCNTSALSLKKIQLMQSPLYMALKDSFIVRKLRKQHRGNFFANETLPEMPDVNVEQMAKKYRDLRAYYVDMYESIDCIHFNSSVTEEIFNRYITPKDSKIISITHREIEDNRNNKHIKSEILRILCLAPAKPFKGFNVLKTALDELWAEGKRNFELKIYSSVQKTSPYMVIQEEGYDYSELPAIFANSDVLIAPSIWYETFGFTVLEAISFGVPVIVSDHVGAKDIVGDGGIIVKAGSVEELKKVISSFEMTQFMNNHDVKCWDFFLSENYSLYMD